MNSLAGLSSRIVIGVDEKGKPEAVYCQSLAPFGKGRGGGEDGGGGMVREGWCLGAAWISSLRLNKCTLQFLTTFPNSPPYFG